MPDTMPVKGTVWRHARRKDWQGQANVYTVTSVNPTRGLIFSTDKLHMKIKTPIVLWGKLCAAVISTPEVTTPDNGPKLTPQECAALHRRAHLAGMAAGEAARPVPMVVTQHASPLDDTSPVTYRYPPVMDGLCGFAHITVRPGNSSFGRWLKANGGYKGYYGGIERSVRQFNQSVERKGAYARAYADVLREAGIKAYSSTRLD